MSDLGRGVRAEFDVSVRMSGFWWGFLRGFWRMEGLSTGFERLSARRRGFE